MAAIGVLVIAVGVLLLSVFQRPGDQQARLIAFLGFTATVVLPLVLTTVRWLWGRRTPAGPSSAAELDDLADRLAGIVRDQWQRAALERHLIGGASMPLRWQPTMHPVASPFWTTISGPVLVEPVPGIALPTGAALWPGGIAELHAVFAAAPSGRVVLLGPAGSGKTTIGILVLLEALRHRVSVDAADRSAVPVPVLVALAGWDPRRERLAAWVEGRLRITIAGTDPGLAGRLHELLAQGRLSVVLDGLDELPEPARPAALRALGEQAAFRLVLLSRTDELVGAAASGHLPGAVALEMMPLSPTDTADHLMATQVAPLPAPWQALLDRMADDPGGAVARALTNPMTVSLVRDTYGPSDRPDELLDASMFPTVAAIEGHLLARVLPSAYAVRPGDARPTHDLERATRVLAYLAWRMSMGDARTLAWWDIPGWVTRRRRMLVVGSVVGLALGVVAGLGMSLVIGVRAGLAAAAVTALTLGVLAAVAATRTGPPRRLGRHLVGLGGAGRVAVRETLGALPAGLMCGVLFSFLGGSALGAPLGAATVAAFAVAGTGVAMLSSPAVGRGVTADPMLAWRDDRRYGLTVAAIGGPVVGLTFATPLAIWDLVTLGPGAALETGLGFGIPLLLLVSALFTLLYPRAFGVWAACVQLRRRHGLPVRVMRFLEDARSRQILRTVGPVYLFRHARLREHLTALHEESERP
jgi:hypothetical protein